MIPKGTLKERVDAEVENPYESAKEAAIDHLRMAQAHLFEEFEGRDVEGIMTLLSSIEDVINNKWLTKYK